MNDLSFSIGDNIGGAIRFYFCPAEGISLIPEPVGQTISSNVLLKELYRWYKGESIQSESLGFTDPLKNDSNGEVYQPVLTGFVAKDTPNVAEAFAAMKGRQFVIICEDRNGHLKLVGNTEQYLTFEYKMGTSDTTSGQNGYQFTFKGDVYDPAYFYTGTIDTTAPVVLSFETDAATGFSPQITKSGAEALWVFANGHTVQGNNPKAVDPNLEANGGLNGSPQSVKIFIDDINSITELFLGACGVTVAGINTLLSQLIDKEAPAGMVVNLLANATPDAEGIGYAQSLDGDGVTVIIVGSNATVNVK